MGGSAGLPWRLLPGSGSHLSALRGSPTARGAEVAQPAHHVVVVLRWWRKAGEDPVEQIGIGAIKQSFELVELGAVQAGEGHLREWTENEVALLRPAVPAPEQEPPAPEIEIVAFAVAGHGAGIGRRRGDRGGLQRHIARDN